MKLVWDWFVALSAPAPFLPGLENIPRDTLNIIVQQDNFESISSLALVNRRFNIEIPRMCYNQFWDQTSAFHKAMSTGNDFELFQCNYVMWAVLHLVKLGIDKKKKIAGLAHFLTFVGSSPWISKKLVRLLVSLTPHPSDRQQFRKALEREHYLHYTALNWDIPSHVRDFLNTQPSLETAYHVPLLVRGVHPNRKETLTRSFVEQFTRLSRDQVEGNADVVIEKWSILGLMKSIQQATVSEAILSVADFFYWISGHEADKHLEYLERFASTVIGKEVSLCYSQSLFEMRMSDPDNAYGLMLFMDYIRNPGSHDPRLMELFQKPCLIDHYRIFEVAYNNLVRGKPVNQSEFSPVMKVAFQNYVMVRMDEVAKSRLQRIFWRTKDLKQCAICVECIRLIDFKYFYRYACKVRSSSPISSTFNNIHWRIIFTRCVFDTKLTAVVKHWIHRDIVESILGMNSEVVESYKSMIEVSSAFKDIFEFCCETLKWRKRISEEQYWQIGHILAKTQNNI